jgi:hypothetical protein
MPRFAAASGLCHVSRIAASFVCSRLCHIGCAIKYCGCCVMPGFIQLCSIRLLVIIQSSIHCPRLLCPSCLHLDSSIRLLLYLSVLLAILSAAAYERLIGYSIQPFSSHLSAIGHPIVPISAMFESLCSIGVSALLAATGCPALFCLVSCFIWLSVFGYRCLQSGFQCSCFLYGIWLCHGFH